MLRILSKSASNTVSVFAVIAIRSVITAIVLHNGTPAHALTFGIDVTQVLALVLSLATNVAATSIMGLTAW